MMDCRDCRERLNDLLEDDFASGEASTRAELRAHLENCPDCRREFELLSAIRADLRSFTAVSAPADLRRRVRSQLLSDAKSAKTTKPLFAFPTRFAMSGGALLAACCLLLIVRASRYEVEVPSLNDPNSAPPTAENFAVPDAAFSSSAPTKVKPAQKPAPKVSVIQGKLKAAATRQTINDFAPPQNIPAPQNSTPRTAKNEDQGDKTPSANTRQFAKSNGSTSVPALKTSKSTKTAPQISAPLHETPDGAISGVGNHTFSAESTTPAPAISLPDVNQEKVNVPKGGVRATNPSLNASSGIMHRSGTNQSMRSSAPLSADLTPNLSVGAQGPQGPLNSSVGEAENGITLNAAPNNTLSPPFNLKNRTRSGFSPGIAKILTRKPDFNIALNTTQTFTLSLMPQQDHPQAQLRLTLSDGLQFADEAPQETQDVLSNNNSVKKLEPSRIIWKGMVQKDMVIENAIELKASMAGFKNATLTLEDGGGQKLQSKIITFQAQTPQTQEKPPAPPTAEDK